MFCARSSFSFSTTNHFGIPPSRTVASKSTRPLPTAFIFYKTSNNAFKTSKILTYPILVVNRRFLSRYKILMLFFFFIFLFYAILYFALLLFTLLYFALLYFTLWHYFRFAGVFPGKTRVFTAETSNAGMAKAHSEVLSGFGRFFIFLQYNTVCVTRRAIFYHRHDKSGSSVFWNDHKAKSI